jgi:hypothetical protein
MQRHGSETFFIEGEGVLGEALGGRDEEGDGPAIAGLTAQPHFRFSRLGPSGAGRQLTEATRRKLAEVMAAGGPQGSRIPAGFTYLGQFLDHDLTFDRTPVTFGGNIPPGTLVQARSPALDLDSMYGAGPADPVSAVFYEADGLHLKVGRTFDDGPGVFAGHDLPRGAGSTVGHKRKAVIPEPRNDENLAVAQTHVAMIHFHNRVVDTLPASVPAGARFEAAREKVTKHYQWMIRHDYLTRICVRGVVGDVFRHGRKAFEVGVPETRMPTMPIEFSVAAFRLGHSMIRAGYNWNKVFDHGSGTLDYLFEFSATSGNLGGNPRLASTWVADFRRLYDFGEASKPALKVPPAQFNRARRIDTHLSDPLKNLPAQTIGEQVPFDDPHANLAFRNLTRARMVRLATGQQMARFLRSKGVSLQPLTRRQIREGRDGVDLDTLTAAQRDAVLRHTPLWFYVLREAERENGRLAGVGARIVAETFHRAMEGSRYSMVRDAAFKPSLGPDAQTFRMVDLLLFAYQGRKNELAPLG